MPQINLAAEVFRARLIARRRRVVYAFSVLVILLVLGSYGLPLLLRKRTEAQIAEIERAIAAIEGQLKARSEDVRAIKLFRQRLTLAGQVLASHTGWSGVLSEFERVTVPPAVFRKVSGSVASGMLTADVVVPTLDVAADLVASLQAAPGKNETAFSSVQVAGVAVSQQEPVGYAVSLRLTVPKEVFVLPPVIR